MLGAAHLQWIVDLAGAEVREEAGSHCFPCCLQEETVLRVLVTSGPGGEKEELVLRARTVEAREEWLAGLRTVQAWEEAPEPLEEEMESASEKSLEILSSDTEVSAVQEYEGSETQTEKRLEEKSSEARLNVPRRPSWLATIDRREHEDEDMKEFDYDLMTTEADLLLVNKVPTRSGVFSSAIRQLVQTRNPSKVRLPACVLEPRSLLESYAAAFGRPDLFTSISQGASCRDRIERATAFYLSQLMCTRPTPAALKPYNPSLGEWFLCQWPSLDSPQEAVTFLAEQVSHHPPVSAMYAECRAAGVSYVGSIATISGLRFKYLLPNALTVENRGTARIILHSTGEEILCSFPDAVAIDLLGSKPMLKLTGSSWLSCDTHGFRVELEFSGLDTVSGRVVGREGNLAELGGSWRGLVQVWEAGGEKKELLDMRGWQGPEVLPVVAPVAKQEDRESRRQWRRLTRALLHSPGQADVEKRKVEDEARSRIEEEYVPRFFMLEESNNVIFRYAL